MVETVRKRPVWVWIISVVYLVSAFLVFWACGCVFGGLLPLPTLPVRSTALDWALSALMCVANIAGAVTLLLLRKHALILFVSVLVLNVAATILCLVSNGESCLNLGIGFVLGHGIFLAIQLSLCLYVWKLIKSGVLQ